MLPWSLMSRIVPVVVFEKTYGIIIGAGVSRRIVGRSAVLNLQEFRGNISFALICYTFSKLSMFYIFFVLNESMSLICLQCLDVLVCVSMNHF